jgi:tetrahydromethanopterin S-methyltransferase subunit G
MPTVEERLSSLERQVDGIGDLKSMIGDFRSNMDRRFDDTRSDMDRRFEEARSDMIRRFDQVDRRFEQVDYRFAGVDRRLDQIDRRLDTLDQRMERHFMWMVGIQFSVLIAVIVALIRLSRG